MKPLPDKWNLQIMWQVAVSSAIEGQGESYEIFARMLYDDLTDRWKDTPFMKLPDA